MNIPILKSKSSQYHGYPSGTTANATSMMTTPVTSIILCKGDFFISKTFVHILIPYSMLPVAG
ncbi:MAG: hypothetical protein AB7O48_16190 [Cyclobacteriaceae bacterium]